MGIVEWDVIEPSGIAYHGQSDFELLRVGHTDVGKDAGAHQGQALNRMLVGGVHGCN